MLTVKPTKLPGVIEVIPRVFKDSRGFFVETYKQSDFNEAGIKDVFVQDNLSMSSRHVIRGIHYQLDPYAQGKLVRVTIGQILDVAVDLRSSSPYFGKTVSLMLSADQQNMVFIPAGFGHGFSVLSDEAVVEYKCTQPYAPETARTIRWDDTSLSIDWKVNNPIISKQDLSGVPFDEAEVYTS